MNNLKVIFNYISDKITMEYLKSINELSSNVGITANDIQENLNIVRNNASTILNNLWKKGELIKINTRPVGFIPKSLLLLLTENTLELKDTYSLKEIIDLIIEFSLEISNDDDPFFNLIGFTESLKNQIENAKAAIVYPPNGLHTLILGESGVGKTTFASAIHKYALKVKNSSEDTYPFISFNCSDYSNNPQLLLSQLFGHIKGAFTGADSEKIGLVERANGGILFLDEIHRLPPDGQEMLFYLMDKGEFHRLGETDKKRKCKILIIAATTETPSDNLLATFLRRIPVTITLPPYKEKSISERIDIVKYAFSDEAKNLNKKIIIPINVLKALTIYPFTIGNIGELRSKIKLLCAKSYLNSSNSNYELSIIFDMLDSKIKNFSINISDEYQKYESYFKVFNKDIIISPSGDDTENKFSSDEYIYKSIIDTLEFVNSNTDNKEFLKEQMNTIVKNNLKTLLSNIDNTPLNISQLYKVVSKDILDYTTILIEIAEEELNCGFNDKFLFVLGLHIQSLLKRIEKNEVLTNPNMSKIKKDYTKEFQTSKKLVKLLSEYFGVIIPESEKGFLTVLLTNNTVNNNLDDKMPVFVICHGFSTASSMANVANTLLDSNIVKSIDMPLDEDINYTYEKFKISALSIVKNNELLLLVDMGSLINFGERFTNETGIIVKTIDNVSTIMVIEALRNVLYKKENLDTIYNLLTNINKTPSISEVPKKKAILTLCATGKGAGLIAKNLLDDILKKEINYKIETISISYFDIEESIKKLKINYNIIAIVGSINPNNNIPYFPIHKLFKEGFQKEFIKFIDADITSYNQKKQPKTIFENAKDLLDEYVKYVNPKFAIVNIKKFIELLGIAYNYDNTEENDELIDLIIHLGCMLDRCIHRDIVKFDGIDDFIKNNKETFNKIRKEITFLEHEYLIKINDDEICYLIKVLNK